MPIVRIIEIEGTLEECLALGNAFISQTCQEHKGQERKPEDRDVPAPEVPCGKPPDREDHKKPNTSLQKAPDTKAKAKVQGSQEQNKGEVEFSPKGKETSIVLQKAPDTKAQAGANGCQEQDKAEVELQEAPDTKARIEQSTSQSDKDAESTK